MIKAHPKLLLKMKDIHVSYRDIKALKGVDFELYKGEIHALVGEHRAGKTTLAKVLSGSVKKDKGEIIYKGEKIDFFTPKSAIEHKIGMVYQDFNVLTSLNTIDYIFAGQIIKNKYGLIKYSEMASKTNELISRLNLKIDIYRPLKELSKADQHMIELVKVLSYDPELIILDEISNKLTPHEMEIIYPLLIDAKRLGKSIIYITHDMDEVFQFADRVTILKDGYRKGTEEIRNIDRIKLIKLTYSFVLKRDELERDNKNLYYFKKYNESIIRNLPIGVIILDPNNTIYMINDNAVKILNYKIGNSEHQTFTHLIRSIPEEIKNEIVIKIKNKEKYTWKEIKLHKDRYVNISIYPFQDEDYVFLGTTILIEDVTKYRHFMEYLLRTQKIASIAELAAGIAHEINNPLGIIQNYIEILKDGILDSDKVEKIRKIDREIQRIENIIGNLLTFSKLNELPNKNLDLVEVIEDVIVLLNHKIKEKQITLIKKIKCERADIQGEENQIKQVFINILVNSIEALPEGGIIKVELKKYSKKSYVLVKITDNGPGIPSEIINNIFDPFFTTKVGKKNTGMGLAICQHIVELHHGLITCQSIPNKMTTFTIRFPAIY